MSFYEKATADFSKFDHEITTDVCQMYINNMRLYDSFGGTHVPYGMTAKLLQSFLTGKKTEDEIRRILSMAARYNELLNLYNIFTEDAKRIYEQIKAVESGNEDLPEGETIESLKAKRSECIAKAGAFWTSLEITNAPIMIYSGLKILNIDYIC